MKWSSKHELLAGRLSLLLSKLLCVYMYIPSSRSEGNWHITNSSAKNVIEWRAEANFQSVKVKCVGTRYEFQKLSVSILFFTIQMYFACVHLDCFATPLASLSRYCQIASSSCHHHGLTDGENETHTTSCFLKNWCDNAFFIKQPIKDDVLIGIASSS